MNQSELDLQPVPEYRTISLTQGQVAIIDAQDYEWAIQFNWQAQWSEDLKSFYAMRSIATGKYRKTRVPMHREIVGATKDFFVDHIDHDTLNNRRSNLRLVNRFQNRWNAKKQKDNISGFKGVSWDEGHKKWRAVITVNRITHHLGRYEDPKEAADAYNKAALELHGTFAYSESLDSRPSASLPRQVVTDHRQFKRRRQTVFIGKRERRPTPNVSPSASPESPSQSPHRSNP
jgi:hypothetical protein